MPSTAITRVDAASSRDGCSAIQVVWRGEESLRPLPWARRPFSNPPLSPPPNPLLPFAPQLPRTHLSPALQLVELLEQEGLLRDAETPLGTVTLCFLLPALPYCPISPTACCQLQPGLQPELGTQCPVI